VYFKHIGMSSTKIVSNSLTLAIGLETGSFFLPEDCILVPNHVEHASLIYHVYVYN